MRILTSLAGTLLCCALLCNAAQAAESGNVVPLSPEEAAAAAAAGDTIAPEGLVFDEWYAAAMEAQGGALFHVTGTLSAAEMTAMREGHARGGFAIDLDAVPMGGVQSGSFFVDTILTADEVARMQEAHAATGLGFGLQIEPAVNVMGMTAERSQQDAEAQLEAELEARIEAEIAAAEAAELRGEEWHGDEMHGEGMHGEGWQGRGEWRGHDGWRKGDWRGKGWDGRRGWRGARGWGGHGWGHERCTPWEKDWHQNGCGTVHVHNLADWLPNHAGWHYGWHYAGWDHDSWPYIRGDGSHTWYTGEFMATHDFAMTPPAWFDAQWVTYGKGYPNRFWLSAANFPYYANWRGGCGCGGCKSVNRCGCGKGWNCGCGHHRCCR
jgi:hypothetical protein